MGHYFISTYSDRIIEKLYSIKMKICRNFRYSLFNYWRNCVQKFKGIRDSSIKINKVKKNDFFRKHFKFTFETWQHRIRLKEQQPTKLNQSACSVPTALSSVSFTSVWCIQRHGFCMVRRTATHKSFYSQWRKIKAVTVWVLLKFLVVCVRDQLP